ncbi:MAG TPA: DUF427 domain-containing protein [Acidimicrobiia bacterium]
MFSTRPEPDPVGPGQESAWAYPRPPRLESTLAHLVVMLGGVTIAETTRAYRVLETSHPPNYYFPPDDVAPDALVPSTDGSYCEWKGRAHYFTVRGGDRVTEHAAWAYGAPSAAFAPLRDHVAFYADRVDACFVDDELVVAQPGGFYGGWITSTVVGPFKGVPGSRGW